MKEAVCSMAIQN